MRTTRALVIVLAIAALSACGLPGGGVDPGDAELSISIDNPSALTALHCTEDLPLGDPFSFDCTDDVTITITNDGVEDDTPGPVYVLVLQDPDHFTGEGDRTNSTITSTTCSEPGDTVVLAPGDSCEVVVHMVSTNSSFNGVIGKVVAGSGPLVAIEPFDVNEG